MWSTQKGVTFLKELYFHNRGRLQCLVQSFHWNYENPLSALKLWTYERILGLVFVIVNMTPNSFFYKILHLHNALFALKYCHCNKQLLMRQTLKLHNFNRITLMTGRLLYCFFVLKCLPCRKCRELIGSSLQSS